MRPNNNLHHRFRVNLNRWKIRLVCFGAIVFFFACHASSFAGKPPINFSLHKLGPVESDRTLLVVGGIQGDERAVFMPRRC